MTLAERLSEYVRACFTGLWIVSHEHDDALKEIAELCRREKWRLAQWDVEQGLRMGDHAAQAQGGPDPLAAIRALREDDQQVIACRYFLELTEAETAAVLGCPRGTVKSRLSRALQRLRQRLAADAEPGRTRDG